MPAGAKAVPQALRRFGSCALAWPLWLATRGLAVKLTVCPANPSPGSANAGAVRPTASAHDVLLIEIFSSGDRRWRSPAQMFYGMSAREQLARIHQALRIERALDRAHHV